MPSDTVNELLAGYRRFRNGQYRQQHALYRQLASGQAPRTMVIACADSRVDPAGIFDAAPGELFVVRNVANLVPPLEQTGRYHGTSAALEFAVVNLGVSNILVMGHGLCGGIAACLAEVEDQPVGQFISPWVALAAAARDELLASQPQLPPEACHEALEHSAIRHSLRNLRTFPFVEAALDAGRLSLHGAWFSIASGELHWLEPTSGDFAPVSLQTS